MAKAGKVHDSGERAGGRIIKGLRLRSWQVPAAKAFKSLGPRDTLVLVSPRQCGKSKLLGQLLLYTAINKPKSHSILVSPVNRQNAKFFKDLRDMVANSPLVTSVNATDYEITFWNKSSVLMLSAEAGDNLRGNTVTGILIVDEACYMRDDIWGIILPFTNVSRAPVVLSSTPRFRNGYFYDCYVKAVGGRPHFASVNASDYPLSFFRTAEQVDEYRSSLPKSQFQSDILGEFITDKDGVFGDFRSCVAVPEDRKVATIGIDWSSTGADSTVLTFLNGRNQMVDIRSFSGLDPMALVDRVAELVNASDPDTVAVESNSIGAVYASALRRKMANPSALRLFTTTNASKKAIIEGLLEAFSRRTVGIMDDPELLHQLSIFGLVQLSRGNYTYAALNNGHDDCVMSLAIANRFNTRGASGDYVISII